MMLVSILLLFVCSKPGYADIMRCETGRVVSSGDTTAEVLAQCGEPTQRESGQECLKARDGKSRARANHQKPFHEVDCVTVETWTYNFGPRRLVQRLTFKNNRLETIQTQGYGQ